MACTKIDIPDLSDELPEITGSNLIVIVVIIGFGIILMKLIRG